MYIYIYRVAANESENLVEHLAYASAIYCNRALLAVVPHQQHTRDGGNAGSVRRIKNENNDT